MEADIAPHHCGGLSTSSVGRFPLKIFPNEEAIVRLVVAILIVLQLPAGKYVASGKQEQEVVPVAEGSANYRAAPFRAASFRESGIRTRGPSQQKSQY